MVINGKITMGANIHNARGAYLVITKCIIAIAAVPINVNVVRISLMPKNPNIIIVKEHMLITFHLDFVILLFFKTIQKPKTTKNGKAQNKNLVNGIDMKNKKCNMTSAKHIITKPFMTVGGILPIARNPQKNADIPR